MLEPGIHIHEDDWAMRNLYPLPALPEAAAELREAAAAGERNRAPDGSGWSDVHVIQEPSHRYEDVPLRVADAAAAVAPWLPRVRRFTATASAGFGPNAHDPWGSYDEEAHCYGFDTSCFLKLETKGELVTGIWFECRESAHVCALRGALAALDALVPSAIVDYWNEMTGPVHDAAFMARYFRELTGLDQVHRY